MDVNTDTPADIKELQEKVVRMRVQYRKDIEKYEKKINKIKIDILEKTNYTAEYEHVDIPLFPFEKYEQLLEKDSDEHKTRKQLKEEIIILRTLLKKNTCTIEKLLQE